MEALTSDVEDVQDGTTAEGIHLGAMAATLDLLQRCYLGLEIRGDRLHLDPLLPERLAGISLPLRFHGGWLRIHTDQRQVRISRADDGPDFIDVTVHDHDARLGRCADRTFTMKEEARMSDRQHTNSVPDKLDPDECMRLISPGGIGRVAFGDLYGPTVLPVNYKVHEGAIVFRTQYGGPMDEQLRTGLEGVEIKIGFEVDRIDEGEKAGWSVLVQGPIHHVPADEVGSLKESGVQPWAGGERELYIRIIPHRVTGRRINAL